MFEGEFDQKKIITLQCSMALTTGPDPLAPANGVGEAVSVRPSGAVKKAVDTLAIVPTRDKISVLTRKVYNVMMHHAQLQGQDHTTFRARLRDVISMVEFNSNNTELLKEYFRSMVTTKVEWQSPTRAEGTNWGVSGLIAHAELITSKGGEVVLEWSYSPKLQQAILDPQRYARISLGFVSQLKTHAALVLYEICSRYVDNPGELTARNHWTWWRPVLTGAPEGTNETYKEWKYFKRDCVAKAVAEVNLITDLEVEAVEHRQGRAMGDLQFRIRRRVQQKLPLRALPTPVDLQDIGRAIALRVPQVKAEKLYERYGAQAFKVALDTLEARVKRNDLDAVRSPEKFLSHLLATPVQPLPAAKPDESKTKTRKIELLENYRAHKRSEAEHLFNEMIKSEQEALVARFGAHLKTSKPAVFATFEKRGLDAPMTRSHFLAFLSNDLYGAGWDNPTDTALLDHAIG